MGSMPLASAAPGGASAAHPLRASADGRHLVQADGRPFFYLADTAWSLFHRLTREEADLYLRNRAAKGFTVIQAVALSENDGLRTRTPTASDRSWKTTRGGRTRRTSRMSTG
jgi:hypothetical protein